MQFKTLPQGSAKALPTSKEPVGYLVRDNWDDYEFKTRFLLYISSNNLEAREIGAVKIAHERMPPKTQIITPLEFETLSTTYYSLGEIDSYYDNLKKYFPKLRETVLAALRDLALDLDRFDSLVKEEENALTTSLMRDKSPSEAMVRGQLHRIAKGGPRYLGFKVSYNHGGNDTKAVDFKVQPGSIPATNVHALIGSNGVGKTFFLHTLAKALCTDDQTNSLSFSNDDGTFHFPDRLIAVSYSSFDPFVSFNGTRTRKNFSYHHIGMHADPRDLQIDEPPFKDAVVRTRELGDAIRTSVVKKAAWLEGICNLLERDSVISITPPFQKLRLVLEAHKRNVPVNLTVVEQLAKELQGLSSGHQIVLNTLIQLVQLVDDQSLVFIDEPETHLHPPLLSTFIRAVSELLVDRNGMALVATHSPVVLQEIPASCVWILTRWGQQPQFSRPYIETFGENVGTLTREIFGLEINNTGFYRLVADLVSKLDTYEEVLAAFNDQLGEEARAFVRILLAQKVRK